MKIKTLMKNKDFMIKLIICSVLLLLLILSFFFSTEIENKIGLNIKYDKHEVTYNAFSNSDYKVCYIDVGQGNSTYIKLPDGKVVLIDAGNIPYSEKVVNTLKDDGVSHIDYLIATHSDSDHIGGFNSVLDEFEVMNIYRPFQIAGTGTSSSDFEIYEDEDLRDVYELMQEKTKGESKISRVTSSIYKDFITKIYNETYHDAGVLYNSVVSVFYDGLLISGENYYIKFFAPLVREDNINLRDYSNTYGFVTKGYGVNDSNGNSAVLMIKIYDEKFLFTGDAPFTSGSEILNSSYEETDFIYSLSSDEIIELSNISVYMVGHHGSKYSSSSELLNLIKAKFNVISVSVDNSYGHPSNEVLERLYNYRLTQDYLLMTKDLGSITFGSVNNELVYIIENDVNRSKLLVSWELLGSIIFIFLCYFTFSIKTKNEK